MAALEVTSHEVAGHHKGNAEITSGSLETGATLTVESGTCTGFTTIG